MAQLTTPIVQIDEIQFVAAHLLSHSGELYHDLFCINLNLGLRVQDLLSLEYSDFDLKSRRIEIQESKQLKLWEAKTERGYQERLKSGSKRAAEAWRTKEQRNKPAARIIALTDDVLEIVSRRKAKYSDKTPYLFRSFDGRAKRDAPVSRVIVHRHLKRACDALNEWRSTQGRYGEINLGTHGMRKTFIRGLHEQGVPSDRLRMITGHSSIQQLETYLGITTEQMAEDVMKLDWGFRKRRLVSVA